MTSFTFSLCLHSALVPVLSILRITGVANPTCEEPLFVYSSSFNILLTSSASLFPLFPFVAQFLCFKKISVMKITGWYSGVVFDTV